MTAEARDGRVRVVPGAGGKLGDPRAHRLIDGQAGQAGAPVVEDPHEVAVVQAAGCRVAGIQPHRLTPGDLDRLAVRADIQLAVEPGPRLVVMMMADSAFAALGAIRTAPDRNALIEVEERFESAVGSLLQPLQPSSAPRSEVSMGPPTELNAWPNQDTRFTEHRRFPVNRLPVFTVRGRSGRVRGDAIRRAGAY